MSENHNLIYGFANKRKLDLEEWYGRLAIQLCETVKKWDKSRGSLSTIYYLNCEGLIYQEQRRSQALKRQDGGMLSLDYEYYSGENAPYDMEDVVVSNQLGSSLEDEVETKLILDKLMEGEHGEIIRLRYEGYTQSEISEIVGMHQSNVSLILAKVLDEYYMERGEG